MEKDYERGMKTGYKRKQKLWRGNEILCGEKKRKLLEGNERL